MVFLTENVIDIMSEMFVNNGEITSDIQTVFPSSESFYNMMRFLDNWGMIETYYVTDNVRKKVYKLNDDGMEVAEIVTKLKIILDGLKDKKNRRNGL